MVLGELVCSCERRTSACWVLTFVLAFVIVFTPIVAPF